MNEFLLDLRSATRNLMRQGGSSLLGVSTLALAVGAITALFALANALLLQPVRGLDQPAQLLETGRGRGGQGFDTISAPLLKALNAESTTVEGVYGFAFAPLNVRAAGEPQRAFGMLVSENYFELLGVGAERGRVLNPVDDKVVGASPHVVISQAAWRKFFQGAPDVVGRNVTLNGRVYQVVGVAEALFQGHIALVSPEFYVPLSMQPAVRPAEVDLLQSTRSSWLLSGARLKAGASLEQAQQELNARFQAYRAEHAESYGEDEALYAAPLSSLPREIGGAVGMFSGVLGMLTLLVLLVACVNVAGLMIARGEARLGELGVRSALGAGRWRIIRLLLVEAALMALLAVGGGLLLAKALLGLVDLGALPTPFPLQLELQIGQTPMLLAVGIGIAATLLFGLWPAWRTSRQVLQMGGRAVVSQRQRAREWLVVGQVACSLVLLVASGLFVRALDRARQVDLGFTAEGVYTADLDLEPTGYSTEQQAQVSASMLERIAAIPGVESVASARLLPLSGSTMVMGAIGDESLAEELRFSSTNVVSPDYFETLGIAVAGEGFATARAGGESVAIVNQALAERLFAGASAIGQTVKYDGVESGVLRIVGVAAQSRYARLSEAGEPHLYLPLNQIHQTSQNLVIKTSLTQEQVDRALRAVFATVDANLPKAVVHSMDAVVAANLLPQRIASGVTFALGCLGLLLALVGTYGLIAYFVASRTREIGVRLSLGATPKQIRREVLARGLRLGGFGLALGLPVSVGLAVLMSGLVFGLEVTDAPAFVLAALALLVSIFAASAIPARRASRISPMAALRQE